LLEVDHLLDLTAQKPASPAEVRLEDLPDVHAGRDAERVEDDVDRRAVREVGKILLRKQAADDALVAVAAGHLVADLQPTLDGELDLPSRDGTGGVLVVLV